MNLKSEQRLSMEELRRLNDEQPSETHTNAEQPSEAHTDTEPPTLHPTLSEWDTLMQVLTHHEAAQERFLREVYAAMDSLPTQNQFDELAANVAATRRNISEIQKRAEHIETMLEQVGRRNERRFSIRRWLAQIPKSSLMLLWLIPTSVALWAASYSLGVLWNSLKMMFA